jgi:PPOX class probable F420-dependent enzyme
MQTTNLADRYDLPAVSWDTVRSGLDAGFPQAPGDGGPNRHTCWLTTINADGSPHVTAVGALWVEDAFWFETGATTRKGRNLARDPRCVLSVATEGFDLVVDGEAAPVTDPDTVARMAAHWAVGGWPCRVDETGLALTADFSAPSAGGPPWTVYRITARRATGLLTTAPGGATTWRF